MSCVRDIDGKKILFVKGAPDTMLEHCTMMLDDDMERKITPADAQSLHDQNSEWATNARRQLVFAYKVLDDKVDRRTMHDDEIEQ